MFTATTTSPANAPVTWSLTGTACTGAGNPCGTINSTTGVYQAPSAPVSATVTATLVSDSTIMGTLGIAVIPVTVVVTPVSVNVGQGLVQQFTAVAVPDAAPQDFTWSCTPTGACGSFGPNPNSVAVYTAPSFEWRRDVVVGDFDRAAACSGVGHIERHSCAPRACLLARTHSGFRAMTARTTIVRRRGGKPHCRR